MPVNDELSRGILRVWHRKGKCGGRSQGVLSDDVIGNPLSVKGVVSGDDRIGIFGIVLQIGEVNDLFEGGKFFGKDLSIILVQYCKELAFRKAHHVGGV